MRSTAELLEGYKALAFRQCDAENVNPFDISPLPQPYLPNPPKAGQCPSGNDWCNGPRGTSLCVGCTGTHKTRLDQAHRSREAAVMGNCMECGRKTGRKQDGEFYSLCRSCQQEFRTKT